MSDTSGLPNTNSEGVPEEDDPARFQDRDAQSSEPDEDEPGQSGALTDEGSGASTAAEPSEPPPAGFDPARNPSNPDLVGNKEPPD